MITSSRAAVHAGGVLAELSSRPPLTLRRIEADDPGVCALCLVGSAAGPLAGDDLALTLAVGAGAAATLEATGASLVQGRRRDEPSAAGRVRTFVSVGPGGSLVADPGPLVICAGGQVEVDVEIDLAASACLAWREVLVLGRSGEEPGEATIRWEVHRGGRPLFIQRVDLTDPRLSRWPGMLAGGRVLASELVVGNPFPYRPGYEPASAGTVVLSPTAIRQRIAERALLATVLGTDVADTVALLDRLRAA